MNPRLCEGKLNAERIRARVEKRLRRTLNDVEFSTYFDGAQWTTLAKVHGETIVRSAETPVGAMIAAEIAVRKLLKRTH